METITREWNKRVGARVTVKEVLMVLGDEGGHSELGDSLLKTVMRSELSGVLADFGELALDQPIPDGVLRDVPIVGTVMGLLKTAITIEGWIFLRKVRRFLIHLQDVPLEDKKQFESRLEANKKYRRRVGEKLIMLLQRFDDMQKCEFLARVFGAKVEGTVDDSEFLRLATAIDRASIQDLRDLLVYFSGGEADGARLAENLYGSGLSEIKIAAGVDLEFGVLMSDASADKLLLFIPNSNAEALARIILRDTFVDPWDRRGS